MIYFILKRNWDLPNLISVSCNHWIIFQISKVINEIYHQYNRHQYPFVALHITMKKGLQRILISIVTFICLNTCTCRSLKHRLMKTIEPRVANWMSIIHMYKGLLYGKQRTQLYFFWMSTVPCTCICSTV